MEPWQAVDKFLEGLLAPEDHILAAALRTAEQAGMPSIQVSAMQGQFLYILARAIGARRILEIGTLAGYSGIWLARALPADGLLVTLEAEPKHAEVARANFATAGLAERIELRVGPALETLPSLLPEFASGFDLCFLDADKPNLPNYFKWAQQLTRKGGLIISDNVVRNGQVVEGQDANSAGARALLQTLGRSTNNTVIQTVGSKGYDGFALTIVE
ncbi:MAG: O-methyltransferase [Anaerolineales bacterium]|nr:MAG: O-methyltransferase [Anaerolineales bacterium]